MGMLFGTAGPPDSDSVKSTEKGVEQAAAVGLDCMEVLFVQGVKMGEETAARVRAAALEHSIHLSCHAPYFINLASEDRAKLDASVQRLCDAARIGSLCGADTVVFHPGYYTGNPPAGVYTAIRKNLEKAAARIRSDSVRGVTLRPEITGKPSQFGSAREVIRLCADVEDALPCIDFSHLYARSIGECNSLECFAGLLEEIESALGRQAIGNLHCHLSGIQFGPKGEVRHIPMKESGLKYTQVLEAMVDCGAAGRIISESPDEWKLKDSLLCRKQYRRLTTVKEGRLTHK